MSESVYQPMSRGASGRLAIRRPCLTDFPAVLAIANWATCHTAANFKHQPETLEHWINLWKDEGERYPWLVAEWQGTVVGFALASPYHSR